MKLNIENWGQIEGQHVPVKLITLQNSQGMILCVTNYGCIVTTIEAPDRDGNNANIVLGYECLDKYVQGHPFFGALAGRYANRIKDGRYEIDGHVFQLEKMNRQRSSICMVVGKDLINMFGILQ